MKTTTYSIESQQDGCSTWVDEGTYDTRSRARRVLKVVKQETAEQNPGQKVKFRIIKEVTTVTIVT